MEAPLNKKNRNPKSIIFAFFLVAAAIVLLILVKYVTTGAELQFDTSIRNGLYDIAGKSSLGLFEFLTELGSKTFIGTGTLVLIVVLWIARRDYLAMATVVLAVVGGDQINKLFKNFVARERPSLNPEIDGIGFSFPSGHAMVGFILYFVATYFLINYCRTRALKITVGFFAFIIILFVGLSRVYLNVHYASDVLGG